MRKYEVFTIIPGTLSEQEVQPVVERVAAVIKDAGVEAVETKALGKMKIAFPIKHVRYGYFYNFFFDAEPESAQTINQKLRIEEHLLRALVRTFDPQQRKRELTVEKQRPAAEEKEERTDEHIEEPKQIEAPVAATPHTTDEKIDMEEIGKKVDKLLEEDLKINM